MGFIINPYLFAAATDADADAFISAAGITDSTQQSAIQTLVTDLKGYGIWTKMKAIYPMVGGTSTTHKYNLKDPQDTDAAFRLVFSGGWTHSSNGALPNGTNAYADTKLTPSSSLSLNSTHISFYSRTNLNSNTAEMGCSNSSGASPYLLLQTRTQSALLVAHMNDNGGSTTYSNPDSLGHYIGNRTASNVKTTFKNGSKVINDTYASNSLNTQSIYLGAYNCGCGSPAYSSKECAFSSIGDGLTDTEAANFYTAVQAFQTTLSRNV